MPWTTDEFPGAALDPQWLWINQGSAVATVANGQLTVSAASEAADQVRFLYQAYTGPIVVTAPIVALSSAYTNYQQVGLAVRDSGTGKITAMALAIDTGSSSVACLEFLRFSSESAFDSAQYRANCPDLRGYLQVEDDGTDLIFRLARLGSHGDGGALTFVEIHREALSDWLASADQIGFFVNALNADTTLLCRWARTGAAPADDEA